MNGAFSRQRQLEDPAALVRPWWLFVVALGLILISLGYVVLQRGLASNSAGGSFTVSTSAAEQIANELLQTTKGLQVTQQQAVDQLQVVQDQLAAQKGETKKLAEQVAILTEKLQTLQQSAAESPAPSALANGSAPLQSPKARH